jgi:hypothetical protein
MPDPLFTQFEIPWMSSLTAGQYDASTSFSASDPVNHLLYSLGVINSYQQQGVTKEPDFLDMPEVPGRQPKSITEAQGADPAKVPTSLFDFKSFTEFFASDMFKDYIKRFGLVILAALIVLLAIYRMR